MRKLLALVVIALAACATGVGLRQSRIEIETGKEEQGLARLAEELDAHPHDTALQDYYVRQKALAAERYLALGDNARAAGALERAAAAYARALRIDPQNERARAGLDALARNG